MNKIFILGLLVLACGVFVAHKAIAQNKSEEPIDTQNKKILIAYYSYSGHTKEAAEAIQKEIGGDLFEIKTEGTYPEEYNVMVEQAKQEIKDGYRPKLTTSVDNMAQYDVVFVGSPNWWGTITPQVSSFLESYDLSGKTVIPFVTHGGGGKQNTFTDLASQCKGCDVKEGWSGYSTMKIGLSGWLKGLGYGK